jgi:hypothetical protein
VITHFIEAGGNDFNHGKFMLGRLTSEELATRSALPGYENERLTRVGGLRRLNERSTLVVDLQTGEGAVFFLDGYYKADLEKTKIWVCPMFEPFLQWLYQQDLAGGKGDITKLPRYVDLPHAEPAFRGYRRGEA